MSLAEGGPTEVENRTPGLSASAPAPAGVPQTAGDYRAARHKRFGWSQVLAGLILLIFLAQGFWLALHLPLDQAELSHMQRPLAGLPAAQSSPATTLLAGAASLLFSLNSPPWLVRLPFLLIGTALGASLWYVARRLCGNAGGGIALALYAFSPTMLTCSARVHPEIVAAWSAFGCIFTAIAVAHTLYAPREVVLWNWKRILLLGTAIGVSAASQLPVAVVAVLGLAFMLYLVPERAGAALAIMAAALAIGGLWFVLLKGLHLPAAAYSDGGKVLAQIPAQPVGHRLAAQLLRDGPGFLLLLLIAFGALCVWRRPRFFGTAAPLLAAVFLILCGVIFPAPGFSFAAVALPFLFVFAAGVWADLLEGRLAPLAMAIALAALAIHAYWPHA
jgi:hypothetical protein